MRHSRGVFTYLRYIHLLLFTYLLNYYVKLFPGSWLPSTYRQRNHGIKATLVSHMQAACMMKTIASCCMLVVLSADASTSIHLGLDGPVVYGR